jgi:hypothetical protein
MSARTNKHQKPNQSSLGSDSGSKTFIAREKIYSFLYPRIGRKNLIGLSASQTLPFKRITAKTVGKSENKQS